MSMRKSKEYEQALSEAAPGRDRSPANGRYFILGTEGSDFIVTDGKGIYKTNEQIITSKLTTSIGEAATTQVRTLTFNDEEAGAKRCERRSSLLCRNYRLPIPTLLSISVER